MTQSTTTEEAMEKWDPLATALPTEMKGSSQLVLIPMQPTCLSKMVKMTRLI